MHLALREFVYWMLRYRRTWRGTLVISVLNPLLFLTALGSGLGTLIHRSAPGGGPLQGVSYAAFLAPGLLAASAMQIAFIEGGFGVYGSVRHQGSYRASAVTPLSPGHILGGHFLFIAFRLLTSCLAFAAVMTAFGIGRPWNCAAAVGSAVLTGLAFAAPLMAFAAGVRRNATLMAVMRYVIMPMYFFCGTFFAVSQLPASVRPLVYATPLWHGVDLCRALVLGQGTAVRLLGHAVVLALWAGAGLVLARRRYRQVLHA